MNPFAAELMSIARCFGVFERGGVCGGTVTVPQCVVLQELSQGERDISGLTAHAGASLSAMTRLVDGLQRKGWVTRDRSEADRRRVVVRLTSPGRREARRLRERTEKAVEAVLARIPEKKRPQVLRSLRLVRKAMEDARCGSAACMGGSSR